jgi:hypothetical protein
VAEGNSATHGNFLNLQNQENTMNGFQEVITNFQIKIDYATALQVGRHLSAGVDQKTFFKEAIDLYLDYLSRNAVDHFE